MKKLLIFLILSTLLVFTTQVTLAYWKSELVAENLTHVELSVGQWHFVDQSSRETYVDFFEDIVVDRSDYTHKVLIKGKEHTEYDVIVVYYSVTDQFYKFDLTKYPAACGAYHISTGCSTPDNTDKDNNPYRTLGIDFYAYLPYDIGAVVRYKKNYYVKIGGNYTLPDQLYGAWTIINEYYDNQKEYGLNAIVIYEGQVYVSNRNRNVGRINALDGSWNVVTSQYQSFNVYNKHDVVEYDGKYYYSTQNNVRNISPDNQGVWRKAG